MIDAALLAPLDLPGGDLLPSTWPLWRDFLLYQVLLGNNVVPSSGAPPEMFYVFIGILVTFLITRGITRFIRHRSASGDSASAGPVRDIVIGGVHIHHQVFGIVLMTLSGLLLIAIAPAGGPLAVLVTAFGVGIGLAFDEFALWLHLDDVYWSRAGRKSIDAVAIVLVGTGVITVVVGVVHDAAQAGDLADLLGPIVFQIEVATVALTFVPAVVCLLKGKPITAGIGVAYIPLGIVGAVRLAKPQSWWARHVYRPQSHRRARSEQRFGPGYDARWDRLRDAIGGAVD